MPTINSLLQSGSKQLQHFETPDLDVEVLLSFVLSKPREHILSHGEDEVSDEQEKQFDTLIAKRAKHKPIAYLIKRKEFYGRDFYVDERVHIPRPATEDLIDYIKESVPPDFSGAMADIGTGSGCIAVTLAWEFPNTKIIATDISEDALKAARLNAEIYNAKINFYSGDLLTALPKPVNIIVSNPPYGWNNGWTEDKEVNYQPALSFVSGTDGLEAIKKIIDKLPQYLSQGGWAFIEFDPRRRADIEQLIKATPFSSQIKKDLAGWDRIARLNYK